MKKPRLTFIGFGNMAHAIAQGLDKTAFKWLRAADPHGSKTCPGVDAFTDNQMACLDADIIVLAVKPQLILDVCQEIKSVVTTNCLIVSIAAGTTTDTLGDNLPPQQAIVRCMPNTPAMIACGAFGLYGNKWVSDPQKQLSNTLFQDIGHMEWVEDESLIDVVTGLSGSGPAYLFYFLSAMIESAEQLGLAKSTAQNLALHTVLGATKMVMEGEESLAELQKKVTSPGGTTAAALAILDDLDFSAIINRAIRAAVKRAHELA